MDILLTLLAIIVGGSIFIAIASMIAGFIGLGIGKTIKLLTNKNNKK